MRTTTVSLLTNYTWNRTDPTGKYVLQQTYTPTHAMKFNEIRPDRDLTPKPVGWLFPKPYSLSLQVTRGPIGRAVTAHYANFFPPGKPMQEYIQYDLYEGSFGSGVDGGTDISLLPVSSNEKRKAEIDALLQLKAQKVNLGVAFAEANQTANFLGDAFSAIGQSVLYCKKGNWKKGFKTLKRQYRRVVRTDKNRLTNDWLGWQYAAKPLIQDVNGAIKALQTRDVLPYWITTVKGVSVHREKSTVLVPREQWNSYQYTLEKFRGYFVRLDYNPGNTFLSSLTSLGVTNPLEVVWELVPFSFVIDWGVSIGDWLSAMDAAVGWEFYSGSCTERREVKKKYSKLMSPLRQNTFAKGQWWVSQDIRGSYRALELLRTPYAATPTVMLPVVKNPLSLGHMANGLSLMVGILSGGLKSYVRK